MVVRSNIKFLYFLQISKSVMERILAIKMLTVLRRLVLSNVRAKSVFLVMENCAQVDTYSLNDWSK